MRTPCAIVGSGNIGTDLMYKLVRSPVLDLRLVSGIDPTSDGLRRARALDVETSVLGAGAIFDRPEDYPIVFEATSASIHKANAAQYAIRGVQAIDLTPARVGPLVVPSVNLEAHLGAPNVNLITCGGQATVPIIAAVARMSTVVYAEIVSTVASASAGPGTRHNIDEFTDTTASALVQVGGATQGKAIMVLNPADPPILMRNTVYCALQEGYDRDGIAQSIEVMVRDVATYVPGYRLKVPVVFEEGPYATPAGASEARLVAMLEVEGAGDYFPPYAGNLDIMTCSAVRVGEAMAARRQGAVA